MIQSQPQHVAAWRKAGGRERTSHELTRLLHAAGLHLLKVVDTPGRLRIAEAVLIPPRLD